MKLSNLSADLAKYIEEADNISYYDLLKYAYDNDMDKWLEELKYSQTKAFVSDYLKTQRHMSGNFYYNLEEARVACSQAEISYKKRHS